MSVVIDGTSGITFPDSSSQSAAAASDLEFIATADASNSSGLVFTGFDSSSYDSYLFTLGNLVPQVDGANLRISISVNGGSSYLTWYDIASTVGSASQEFGVSGRVEIFYPHLVADTWFRWLCMFENNSGSDSIQESYTRAYNAYGEVNTVRFNYSNGYIENGTVTMYGYKNA